MTNDAEWVQDVRRWVAGAATAVPVRDAGETTDLMALGYEAAYPAIEVRHWPDAAATGFGDSAR